MSIPQMLFLWLSEKLLIVIFKNQWNEYGVNYGVNFSKNEQKNTQWCEPKGVLKR